MNHNIWLGLYGDPSLVGPRVEDALILRLRSKRDAIAVAVVDRTDHSMHVLMTRNDMAGAGREGQSL
jgi:hypothetical protein